MKRARAIACCLVALALAGVVASGAGATAGAQPTTAMLRYENGTRLYATQRFVEAAHEFAAAYALSQQAELLFNLGRAWEDAGELVSALEAYERFYAAGAPGYDVTQLRARIAGLRARLTAAQAALVVVPLPTRAVAPPPRRVAPATAPVGSIVLMALGGAALAGVIPLWVASRSTFDDLVTVCPMRVCPTAFRVDALRAERLALTGDLLLGLGVASVGAGLTWLLLDRRAAPVEGARRITLGCTADGCSAGVGGSF